MTMTKNEKLIGCFFLCLSLLLIILGCASYDKKDYLPIYIEQISGYYKIPDNYKSYTLFFATSYVTDKYLIGNSKDELKSCFKNFGESIGEENLAVWVRNPDSDDLNIQLGKTYADRINDWYNLNLEYSGGPYLVFMTHSPDAYYSKTGDDFVVAISFKNKTPADVIEAIEYLEEKIRRKEISKFNIRSRFYWLDAKSFVSNNKNEIKSAIKEIKNIIIEVKTATRK